MKIELFFENLNKRYNIVDGVYRILFRLLSCREVLVKNRFREWLEGLERELE